MLSDTAVFYWKEEDIEDVTGGELRWLKAALHASRGRALAGHKKAFAVYKCTGSRRVLSEKYMEVIRKGGVYLAERHAIVVAAYVPPKAVHDSRVLLSSIWAFGLEGESERTVSEEQLCLL